MSTESPTRSKSSLTRRVVLALCGLAIGLACGYLVNTRILRKPLGPTPMVNQVPLEFPASGTWINSDQPLTLAGLKGRVVLLKFSFIGCGPCREMDPYIHKWHEELTKEGLVVIEIDDGKADKLERLRTFAAERKMTHPIYHDDASKMGNSYGIEGWPTMFLIGRDGKVANAFTGWTGAEDQANREKIIRNLLTAK